MQQKDKLADVIDDARKKRRAIFIRELRAKREKKSNRHTITYELCKEINSLLINPIITNHNTLYRTKMVVTPLEFYKIVMERLRRDRFWDKEISPTKAAIYEYRY